MTCTVCAKLEEIRESGFEFPHMPLYVNDYRGGTGHLELREHGAYLLLLFHYWSKKKPLPTDPKRLSKVVGVRACHWSKIWNELEEFFDECKNGFLHNSRLDEGLASAYQARVSKRRNGAKGGRPKKSDRKPTGFDLRNLNKTEQKAYTRASSLSLSEEKKKASLSKKTGDQGGGKRKPETEAPDSFPITERMRQWLEGKNVPLSTAEREAERFLAHHGAKGSRFRDWQRAFQTWILNGIRYGEINTGGDDPDDGGDELPSWA